MVTLSRILEAILFASAKPLPAASFRDIFKAAAQTSPEDAQAKAFASLKEDEIEHTLKELQQSFAEGTRGFDLVETAGGWQVVSHPDCGLWVRCLFPEFKPTRLSAPAMETLAIIAYRQPITRADIEAVRGVAVDGVMQTLLDRGLVKIAGRAEVPGRPLIYETTQFFMDHFGLKNLEELPNSDELRHIPLPKAEEVAKPAEPSDTSENSTYQAEETTLLSPPSETPEVPPVAEESSSTEQIPTDENPEDTATCKAPSAPAPTLEANNPSLSEESPS